MEIRIFLIGVYSLLSLPQDVFGVISRSLFPSDICNLSLCCKSLCDVLDSDKIWFPQCEVVKVLPLVEILQWRIGISSYKKLCRFLVEVIKPLVGIWVQPEQYIGNVFFVMPGYLSVVGCRIFPEDVHPLEIQEAQVWWSPVFEIICDFDGSIRFFLHGKDNKGSFLYPGFVMGFEKSCNRLQLVVEALREKEMCSEFEKEASRRIELSSWKLPYNSRIKLLDIVTSHVGMHVPESLIGRLFLTS